MLHDVMIKLNSSVHLLPPHPHPNDINCNVFGERTKQQWQLMPLVAGEAKSTAANCRHRQQRHTCTSTHTHMFVGVMLGIQDRMWQGFRQEELRWSCIPYALMDQTTMQKALVLPLLFHLKRVGLVLETPNWRRLVCTFLLKVRNHYYFSERKVFFFQSLSALDLRQR